MSDLLKYLRTSIHLKPEQLIYRLYYSIKRKLKLRHLCGNYKYQEIETIPLKDLYIHNVPDKVYLKDNTFTFLNKPKRFNNDLIDWNFMDYGLLWAYNLNYFDFLFSRNVNYKTGYELIKDYIKSFKKNTIGPQSYPTSIRGINWIKFISLNNINDSLINSHLFCQYKNLNSNIEYDISGNHLIENACSLLFAGIYFRNTTFYKTGEKILSRELKEQVLNDGAHYELSPMYHNIILYRLVDLLILLENNNNTDYSLSNLLMSKMRIMMQWSCYFTFPDGRFPKFGDSTYDIAPTYYQLREMASSNAIKVPNTIKYSPNESGFRKFVLENITVIIKTSNILATHQPGHIHNDVLSFEMYYKDKPVIVDTGVSTYEDNARRHLERSIHSHNSIIIDNYEPNELWKSFRVGRRARSEIICDSKSTISVISNRYLARRKKQHRTVIIEHNSIRIIDRLINCNKSECFSLIHFHPSFAFTIEKNRVLSDDIIIVFNGYEKLNIRDYYYSFGFNKTERACMLISNVNPISEIEIIEK